MTIDDYYTQRSDSGTAHLAQTNGGPALCGYAFEGRARLVLDVDGGVEDVCQTCAAKVR